MEYLEKLSGLYQYDQGRSAYGYALSWKKVNLSKVHRICIGELDENGKYLTHSFVTSANHLEGTFLEVPPVQGLVWCNLFVVGLSQGENFSVNAMYEMDPERIRCRIPCACGNLQWSIGFDRHTGVSVLNLTCTTDVPEGIIFLCYDFAGVEFKINVPDLIRAGQSVSFPFYLPSGADHVRLEKVGTAIELQGSAVAPQKNDQKPEPNPGSRGGFLGGLFGKRRR